MTDDKSMDAFAGIVELLKPLSSDERGRVLHAALAFLGEPAPSGEVTQDSFEQTSGELPPRVRAWMKQSGVSIDRLNEVFHFSGGDVEIIAAHLPGKSKKEQTYAAYVLTGMAQFLRTGEASFDDKAARAVCERFGCYDSANHAVYLKNRGNEFTGSKEKGWVLTAPGLARGADLIKDLSKVSA